VLAGDVVDEGEVLGFGYEPTSNPHAGCDQLLLVGEEGATRPPARPVPSSAEEVRTLALTPSERPGVRVLAAEMAAPGLAGVMREVLAEPEAPWGVVGPPLVEVLAEAHFSVWVAGGATRDIVGGAKQGINDLDLAGTAPPGRFCEIARSLRKRLGLELRPKVSADSLVCWALDPRTGTRIYEYRTLNLTGLAFPASASDLIMDAASRDLTVNSLYYDPVREQVLDPTGRGLADLAARPRKLVSHKQSDSLAGWAEVIVRAVKFAVRWQGDIGFDGAQLRDRLTELPQGLADQLTDEEWSGIADMHRSALMSADPALQRHIAAQFGSVAAGLFARLLGEAAA
jgi:hypothetical protein